MIEFKFAMRTEDGTRMFRAVVDGQVCIRPEWMFDPFREAVPAFRQGPLAQAREDQWLQYLIEHPDFDEMLTQAEAVDPHSVTYHDSVLRRVIQAQRELKW